MILVDSLDTRDIDETGELGLLVDPFKQATLDMSISYKIFFSTCFSPTPLTLILFSVGLVQVVCIARNPFSQCPFFSSSSLLSSVQYGYKGCGVFIRGIQIKKISLCQVSSKSFSFFLINTTNLGANLLLLAFLDKINF